MIDMICITCSMAGAADVAFAYDETQALADRRCPKCSSGATLEKSVFMKYASRVADAKRQPVGAANRLVGTSPKSLSPSLPTPGKQVGVVAPIIEDGHGGKWAAHVLSVRSFLLRGTPDCISANSWWDGYNFLRACSWDCDVITPQPEQLDWLVLTLVNKDGSAKQIEFYFDPADEGMSSSS